MLANKIFSHGHRLLILHFKGLDISLFKAVMNTFLGILQIWTYSVVIAVNTHCMHTRKSWKKTCHMPLNNITRGIPDISVFFYQYLAKSLVKFQFYFFNQFICEKSPCNYFVNQPASSQLIPLIKSVAILTAQLSPQRMLYCSRTHSNTNIMDNSWQ